MFQINPAFDKKDCVIHMIQCTKKHYNYNNSFHSCAEYWEPLFPLDPEISSKLEKPGF